MNKMTLLLIALVCVAIYSAYSVFISDVPEINNDNPVLNQFDVIQPLDISSDTEVTSKSEVKKLRDSRQEEQDLRKFRSEKRKEYRAKIVNLQKNKKLDYVTLGNMIDNMKAENFISEDMNDELEFIQHNLTISKKMAALTKKLHSEPDENGDREFDQDVFDELLKIQEGLLIRTLKKNKGVE